MQSEYVNIVESSNLVIDSASRWVGGWWVAGLVIGGWLVGGSMVCGFNKTQETEFWSSDFASTLWLRFILLF